MTAVENAASPQLIVLMPGEGETVPSGPNQVTFKVNGNDTGGGFSLIEYSVTPNFAAPPAYFHTQEIWAAYVLEGSLEFQFGERKITAPAGTFILSPRDMPSTWSNPNDQPAKWLIIFAPPGFEQMYRDLDTALKAMPAGPFDLAKAMPILLPIWAKYGVQMVNHQMVNNTPQISPQEQTMSEPTSVSTGAATSEAPTQSAPPQAVQNPLTLIMTIKSPEDYQALNALLNHFQSLPPEQNPIAVALQKIGTVHFARFVFLENNTKMAVITTFDGSFEKYINDFVNEIGDIFNALLSHMEGAPTLPVQSNRKEFLAYVQANNLLTSSFYSAYPTLSVLDIQALAAQN